MNGWKDSNWYAVQTKPHRENVAAAHFVSRHLDVLLPRVRSEMAVGGVARCVTRPLFPGYFFAEFCLELSLDTVRFTQGVLRVVSAGKRPLALAPEIIDRIRERIGLDGFVRLERRPLGCGEQVLIEAGPFSGWMGRVERELDDGRRVLILLEVLQQARLLIERRQLTPVAG